MDSVPQQYDEHCQVWRAHKRRWVRGLTLRSNVVYKFRSRQDLSDHADYIASAERIAKALGYTCYNALKANQEYNPRINRCLNLLAGPHGMTILKMLEEQNKA